MKLLQIIQLGKVTFELKEPHQFDWLTPMGEVFTVFDQQDSGNLSFGVERDGVKTFVKYAGAKPTEFTGKPEKAVAQLKQAALIYEELQHPNLIRMLDHFETEQGYVLVFEWFDGECLHSHWSYPPPLKYTHPKSPTYRYKQLPIEQRLTSFDAIVEFYQHVERKNYVAVDFYDGSILYDFLNDRTRICDIDYFQKKPFFNSIGRLWGSSRFMAPEEFELGAEIDGRTNVYNLGATAFALLGGETDRSFSKWAAGEALYQVAMRAVQAERMERYGLIAEFQMAWKEAAG
ncbi:pkinase [Bacillus sp. JCM 19046]|nr:pkinase [Bacillus sp. JCM 19045]GAF17128.1 pkinase [Bacillus sp. JCM 19046]